MLLQLYIESEEQGVGGGGGGFLPSNTVISPGSSSQTQQVRDF